MDDVGLIDEAIAGCLENLQRNPKLYTDPPHPPTHTHTHFDDNVGLDVMQDTLGSSPLIHHPCTRQ